MKYFVQPKDILSFLLLALTPRITFQCFITNESWESEQAQTTSVLIYLRQFLNISPVGNESDYTVSGVDYY